MLIDAAKGEFVMNIDITDVMVDMFMSDKNLVEIPYVNKMLIINKLINVDMLSILQNI